MTSDFIYSVDRLKDYRRLENTFDLNKLEDNDELLSGENFIKIADSIYSNDNTIWKFDHRRLENTFDLNNLKDINIVYFHTMYKDYFFDLVKSLKNKFIVITHNTDLEVNNLYNLPRNVIKWYSTNVNIIDERVEPIPIGLENNNWFPHLKKQEKIFEKIKTIKCCKNLVYMNHNIGTNIEERRIPFDLLKEEDFVTTQMGANGKYFDSYLDNVYNHKFVICPEGNGIDTHITWETLYLGSIPIVKRCVNNLSLNDLPICFIDYWSDVTEEFLNKEYDRITNTTNWNLEKLTMNYWLKKIKAELNEK